MNKIDVLYSEYDELKNKYLKNNSVNLKEEVKNKLIELDYEINREYEEKLNKDFSMTTTLDKEEKRLEKLISFINEKKEEQKRLIDEYEKLTGLTIELSYLKYSDKLTYYKKRLELVRSFLEIKDELTLILKDTNGMNNLKVKSLKNKLMKKDMLNLLYEFCLIDSLDIKDIDVYKIIENKTVEPKEKVEDSKTKPETVSEQAKEIKKPTNEEVVKEEKEEEIKIFSAMPKIEKLGTVSPVNVFESINKTKESLPDVVIPSNGLVDDKNDIFLDTKNYFN